MGRHHFAKDYKVSVGPQGQRRTYYDHDNDRDQQYSHPPSGRGSVNRVWRRPDKRVSFNEKRGGAIAKRGGSRGGHGGRPRFDTSRVAALLETDEDMRGAHSSGQAGRARPATRSIRGKFRGGRSGGMDRNRFVKLAPLSDDNKTKIQEAMNKRYNPASKALDLENFGADQTFGGSSNAIGKLSDERVMDCVVDTIGQHLCDLEAVNLSNNNLRTLRAFAKTTEKAPNIKIIYLEHNQLAHSRELDFLTKLNLIEIKLDGNPLLGNFKDGSHYSSVIQKKFKSLRLLDGKELPKLISFEEDESASVGPRAIELPSIPKMVVNDQVGDFIGKFLEQYFKVYDSDNREALAMAYHEEAMMSMSVSLFKPHQDKCAEFYIPESRNLNVLREEGTKRDRVLHQKRLQIIGFLDKLPKTRHDLTSFTLDVPFATERLVTFTVSGAFKERAEKASQLVRYFSRMFVVVPQGEGLCIVNDTLFITNATKEQVVKSNSIFNLAEMTNMNVHWSKICLEGQNWDFDKAVLAFRAAEQEGKIPKEAYESK